MTISDSPTKAAQPTVTFYIYFVAFQYFTAGGLGFGNREVPLMQRITQLRQIQEIEQDLREQGYRDPLVTGYNLLRQETLVDTRGRRR
jgi:hypothetical protein